MTHAHSLVETTVNHATNQESWRMRTASWRQLSITPPIRTHDACAQPRSRRLVWGVRPCETTIYTRTKEVRSRSPHILFKLFIQINGVTVFVKHSSNRMSFNENKILLDLDLIFCVFLAMERRCEISVRSAGTLNWGKTDISFNR